MNSAFQRGLILLQQNRRDLAEREFRRALAGDPDDPAAHAYLAICLIERGAKAEALREADEAVRLEAATAFFHYVRGLVLLRSDRPRDAEAAAEQAIALDPRDADHFGLRASVAMNRERWTEALEAADEGLALDPTHQWCTNLRAMALVHLGRKDEAGRTLGSALAEDPEDALTHANQGWALLHAGDHKQALVHFREALRLDPENAWARAGLLESLKARYVFYRLTLAFFLWMRRQGRWAQVAVVLGIVFGPRLLRDVARGYPGIEPLVTPLLILGFGFVLMTWVAGPLANFLLQFHPLGRLALTREEKVQASLIGGFFAAAALCLAGEVLIRDKRFLIWAFFFGLMIFPLGTTFQMRPGRPRLLMALATVALALLATPSLVFLATEGRWPIVPEREMFNYWRMFLMGAVLSSWLPFAFTARGWARG
jgi:Tfp pilus assembly protein PilF